MAIVRMNNDQYILLNSYRSNDAAAMFFNILRDEIIQIGAYKR